LFFYWHLTFFFGMTSEQEQYLNNDGVRFTHEHRTSCYHRKAEAQEKEAAAKVAATAASVGDEM
jgi:hypothetical protein